MNLNNLLNKIVLKMSSSDTSLFPLESALSIIINDQHTVVAFE